MIHPNALVDDLSAIGPDTNIWAFAHVMAGARVGNHCNIGDHAFVESGAVVGDNVTLKNGVLVWDGITIEDDVFVGPGVSFSNDRFPRAARAPNAKQRYAEKSNWLESTLVQQGCSIGARATICPGVKLGRYSMIGAGSVVTSDVEPFSLVIGSPARRVNDVCSCGQKLAGYYLEADCLACGETVAQREAGQYLTASSPEVS
jgi:UDP-2-acetamido-3-amino-2,3-dideoxy-glucuronate N-acetyltransferase